MLLIFSYIFKEQNGVSIIEGSIHVNKRVGWGILLQYDLWSIHPTNQIGNLWKTSFYIFRHNLGLDEPRPGNAKWSLYMLWFGGPRKKTGLIIIIRRFNLKRNCVHVFMIDDISCSCKCSGFVILLTVILEWDFFFFFFATVLGFEQGPIRSRSSVSTNRTSQHSISKHLGVLSSYVGSNPRPVTFFHLLHMKTFSAVWLKGKVILEQDTSAVVTYLYNTHY